MDGKHAGQKRKADGDAEGASSSSGGQVYHLAFTWSLWDEGKGRPDPPTDVEFGVRHVELSARLRKLGHYIFQLERGETTGRLHYQGYLHLTKGPKRRPSALGSDFGTSFYGIHFSAASTAGVAALKSYCMKDDTKVDGPWKDTDPIVRSPAEMKRLGVDLVLRPWQQYIADQLSTVVHPRHVHVIYDPDGGMGKSVFAKWLEATGRASTYSGFAKAADLAHCLLCEGERHAYVFDLVRTKPSDVSATDLYTLIEQVKNGMFTSTKYTPQKVIRPAAHVWVFTNYLPPFTALSSDRWRIWVYNPARQEISIAPSGDIAQYKKASYIEAKVTELRKKSAAAEWDAEAAEILATHPLDV